MLHSLHQIYSRICSVGQTANSYLNNKHFMSGDKFIFTKIPGFVRLRNGNHLHFKIGIAKQMAIVQYPCIVYEFVPF